MTPTVALLGLPWDEHSSFLRGAARAPQAIRAALRSPSTNLSTESGLDLGTDPRFSDAGDLEIPPGPAALDTIERGVARVLASGARVLALGGDHAITYPVLRAQAARHPGLTLVHLDAHPDLYDAFEGDRLSHACPFARILEEKLVRRLVQVGIRTLNAHQRKQAERFGVERIEMKDWRPDLVVESRRSRLRLDRPRRPRPGLRPRRVPPGAGRALDPRRDRPPPPSPRSPRRGGRGGAQPDARPRGPHRAGRGQAREGARRTPAGGVRS